MKTLTKIFLTVICFSLFLFAGCKDNNNITNGPGATAVITAVTPDSGRFGNAITISGMNFGATPEANTVFFNGVEAVLRGASETLLVAEVPKGAGDGPVEVTVNGQTASGPEFRYLFTVTVSTWAGSNSSGDADGDSTHAEFNFPRGITITPAGTIFVADQQNNLIRRINSVRGVTTFAGSGITGTVDGNGRSAQFSRPRGIAVDADGVLYVAAGSAIRRISPGADVTTFTGAEFNNPSGLVVDASGNLYVADEFNHQIKKVTPDGEVSTLAGSGEPGYNDGPKDVAQFDSPWGVSVGPDGTVFVADHQNRRIRAVDPGTGDVSTVAGTGESGLVNGPAGDSVFRLPLDVLAATDGTLYVADASAIRRISPEGIVSTLAGNSISGNEDGPGSQARFALLSRVVVDADGNLFLADSGNHSIRKITIE